MALLHIKRNFSSLFNPSSRSSPNGPAISTHDPLPRPVPPTTTKDLESALPVDPELPSKEGDKKERRQWTVNARTVSDATLGLSDGLTVPFALTAGLSSLGSTKFVILGGLAELIAGAISMGLGGFVGAKSEEASYRHTLRSTRKLISDSPSKAASMVHDSLSRFQMADSAITPFVSQLQDSPDDLLQFLMTFYHEQSEPDSKRALISAITIALAYFIGGFIPIIPYFIVRKNDVLTALWWSIGVMVVALFVFGYAKTCIIVGWRGRESFWAGIRGAVQMIVVGGIAAGAAAGLVRALDQATTF